MNEPRFVARWVTPLTAALALCALLVQPDDGHDAIVVAVGMVSGWLL
jgi:hypothetical protein